MSCIKFCVCGSPMSNRNSKYCSNKCQARQAWNARKQVIETEGEIKTPRLAKRYLGEVHGNKCSICGIKDWLDKPLTFILDHINGNAEDWHLNNLRLICSNCDSQLPTYKSRNRGHGRHNRKVRYQEGKSY